MNTTTPKLTLVAIVMISGLFCSEQPTSAHSNCREVKGRWIDVYPGTGNVTTGMITNAGIFKGTTETVFDSAALPTPDPTTVSYTADLTITTNHGQLKTRNVYLFDFRTGFFTIIARIDPDTSTGRFAGATGVLFPSGQTIGNGLTYQAEISGELCLAAR
jgi:hypothetical protein